MPADQRPGEAASSQPVVAIRNAVKRYKLYHNVVTGPVKELLMPWRKEDFFRRFLAVDNVSFEVQRGEVVGIIGVNGSGKTTLLKLIAGLLPLDGGEVIVNGSVATLLALAVGIHPEYSGRENIYYSGLLFGMPHDEITAKMDAIIEFADIGEFIDMPMRTYSSGMQARVLFALAMSLERDIFVIDEALATGDTAFFAKSQKRIIDLCESGTTILFVSHSLTQVRDLCDRVIVMDKGRIVGDGDPETEIKRYMRLIFDHRVGEAKAHAEKVGARRIDKKDEESPIKLGEVTLRGPDGKPLHGIHTGQRLQIEVTYRSELRNTPVEFFCGFCLKDSSGFVAMINSSEIVPSTGGPMTREEIIVNGDGRLTVMIDPLILLTNHYKLWLMFYDARDGSVLGDFSDLAPFFVGRQNDSYNEDAVCIVPAQLRHESVETV
jgi:ABC-type polysaccharide/polyol phosphate transport system ATPase subunit